MDGSTTRGHVVGPMRTPGLFKIWRMNSDLCYRRFNDFDISFAYWRFNDFDISSAQGKFSFTVLGALPWVPSICMRLNYCSIVLISIDLE